MLLGAAVAVHPYSSPSRFPIFLVGPGHCVLEGIGSPGIGFPGIGFPGIGSPGTGFMFAVSLIAGFLNGLWSLLCGGAMGFRALGFLMTHAV